MYMVVTVAMLLAREETQWMHQVQMVARPCHRDVEQAALFFDLLRTARHHV